MFRLMLFIANLLLFVSLNAQKKIREIFIETSKIQKHDSIHFQEAHFGRKTNVILLQSESANKGNNNYRELFNKVPNIFIWESDASQLQTNISTRGLSPNISHSPNQIFPSKPLASSTSCNLDPYRISTPQGQQARHKLMMHQLDKSVEQCLV